MVVAQPSAKSTDAARAAKRLRAWCWVHKWTSLICTLFLLMLCITGLPLIFHHEIEHLLGNEIEAPEMPAGTPHVSLDRVIGVAEGRIPDKVIQFVYWDKEEHPDLVLVSMADTLTSPPNDNTLVVMDARTARVLGEPGPREGLMYFILTLHTELFAGIPGKLFLGFMGLLFVIAIVSGVVIYAPFMRRLDFGAVRREKSARVKWLDLHNLLGIVTVTWVLVVGMTGIINTLSDQIEAAWQAGQLADMVAPYKDLSAPDTRGSLENAVNTARSTAPQMSPAVVAFPGTPFASPHHYAVFMSGDTPLTSRLIKPALIEAETARLTDMRDMPWYVNALFVSVPLHFGDYGGMPLKIIWAILDIIAIIVLGSGLYLWWSRRKAPVEARLDELEGGQSDPEVRIARGVAE